MKKSNKSTIDMALCMNVVTDMIGDYTNIGEGTEELRTMLRLKGIDFDTALSPVSDAVDEYGTGGLHYGRTDEWLAVEAEFKPKVIDICKKLAPHADREVGIEDNTHLGRLVKYNCDGDFFDTLWDYGYGGVDKAVKYFPSVYNIQLNVLNELVDWIESEEK